MGDISLERKNNLKIENPARVILLKSGIVKGKEIVNENQFLSQRLTSFEGELEG